MRSATSGGATIVKAIAAANDTQTVSMFDDVRSSCRAVAERATHVAVDGARVPAYADELRDALAAAEPHLLDGSYFAIRDPDLTANLVVTFATINFGSGFFPVVR